MKRKNRNLLLYHRKNNKKYKFNRKTFQNKENKERKNNTALKSITMRNLSRIFTYKTCMSLLTIRNSQPSQTFHYKIPLILMNPIILL